MGGTQGSSEETAGREDPRRRREIEPIVLHYLAENARVPFRRVLRAVEATVPIARGTLARHLARMVAQGAIARSSAGLYSLPPGGPGPSGCTVRFLRGETRTILHADGSEQNDVRKIYTVVSGRLSRLVLRLWVMNRPPDRRTVYLTASEPAHLEFGASDPQHPGHYAVTIVFDPPVPPRDGLPVEFTLGWRSAPIHRLAREHPPPSGAVLGTSGPYPAEEYSSMGLFARPLPELAQETGETSYLQLSVDFPTGYPFERPAFRVGDLGGGETEDREEEMRLRALSRKRTGAGGLRRYPDRLQLGVPWPKLQRDYRLVWRPPSRGALEAWRKGAGGSGSRGRGRRSAPLDE